MVTTCESTSPSRKNGIPRDAGSEGKDKPLPPGDVERVASMGKLAHEYYTEGNIELALQFADKAIQLGMGNQGQRSKLPISSVKYTANECSITLAAIEAFDGLATRFTDDGKQAAALRIREGLVGMCRNIMGEEHGRTVTAVAHLANTHHALADWPNAAKFGRQAVTVGRRVLGWNTRAMRLAVCVLAETYMHLGQRAESEQICREAIQEMQEMPLNDTDLLVRTMACLSDMCQDAVPETAELSDCLEVFLREYIPQAKAENTTLSDKAIMGAHYFELGHHALAADALFRINKERQRTRNSLVARPLKMSQQYLQDMLSRLYREPASAKLQEWLDNSSKGLLWHDEQTPLNHESFFAVCKDLADICGLRKDEYYENPLRGLHDVTAFADLLNISTLDAFSYQCAPAWTYMLEPEIMMVYTGDGPSSQAITDLLLGPTPVDCGMGRAILFVACLWRYMGRDVFDMAVPSEYLTITQSVPSRMDNLLWPFFDKVDDQISSTDPHIQLRTISNDPSYLARHPTGSGRLQHTLCYSGQHVALTTNGLLVLSEEDLQRRLIAAFNKPRTAADREFLERYKDRISEKSTLFEGARLDESAWCQSAPQRAKRERGLQFVLNMDRLNYCLKAVKIAYQEGTKPNIISIGRAAKEADICADSGIRPIATEARPLVIVS